MRYKHTYLRLLILLLPVLMAGCKEFIDLKPPPGAPRCVVECYLTTQAQRIQLTLTQSGQTSGQAEFVPIPDASVWISNGDQRWDLVYDPRIGGYISLDSIAAVPGQTYRATILVGGDSLTAESSVPELTGVLSAITYKIDSADYRSLGYGRTAVTIYGQDPGGERWYWLRVRTGNTYSTTPTGNLLFDNEKFKGQFIKYDLPTTYASGLTLSIELWTLPQHMYTYQSQLQTLVTNTGPFGVQPANPKSNLVNHTRPQQNPLGYFGAAGMNVRTVRLR